MTLFKKRDKNIEHMSWSSKTMSVEEYQELERLSEDCRYEYINGKAYKRKGVSVGHDCIARNIWTALNSQLRSGPCRIFSSGVQVLLEETQNNRLHYVYPDNTITCNCADWRPHNTLIETPRVVIEILAPDTETKDRGVKFKAYQNSPTVQEIVLVNQYYPYVEIWQRDEEHPENPHAWHYRH